MKLNKGFWMKVLKGTAAVLVVAGGVNWALVGIGNFNLVEYLVGGFNFWAKTIYVAVGVSALYRIPAIFKGVNK